MQLSWFREEGPIRGNFISRLLLPMAVLALPVVLVWTSVRTFRELDEQKAVYLRNHVALVASRLENIPEEGAFERLAEEEPHLVGLVIVRRDDPETHAANLTPLWNGLELFRTGSLELDGVPAYRAYIPFHAAGGLRIARIDLDGRAADFLVVHARHNVLAALTGGLVLVILSLYALWMARRTAAMQMKQLELEHLARLGRLAAVLAHEIRNPLGTIKGFAQLAAEQASDCVKELLAPILTETGRLEHLVNDLLLYGRPPTPAFAVTGWSRMATAIEAHARQQIGDRPIRFQVERSAVAWETDANLLQQILLNLVRNAIEAIPSDEPGEISIRLDRRGGVSISVTDTGPGIPPADEPRVWEPFFTTKPFGTGLGLPITAKLAEALGGTLALQSRDGGGTVATVRFPAALTKNVEVSG